MLVISGPGNNGGDGLVCARHLKHFVIWIKLIHKIPPNLGIYAINTLSKTVKKWIDEAAGGISFQFIQNRLIIKQTQTQQLGITFLDSIPTEDLSKFKLIVDAIFGFSFKPPIREPFLEIIRTMATQTVPVFSIDIPSGSFSFLSNKIVFRLGCWKWPSWQLWHTKTHVRFFDFLDSTKKLREIFSRTLPFFGRSFRATGVSFYYWIWKYPNSMQNWGRIQIESATIWRISAIYANLKLNLAKYKLKIWINVKTIFL